MADYTWPTIHGRLYLYRIYTDHIYSDRFAIDRFPRSDRFLILRIDRSLRSLPWASRRRFPCDHPSGELSEAQPNARYLGYLGSELPPYSVVGM